MMEEQGVERIFTDTASGKNTDRIAFQEMMAFIREGDVVIVESISRIARNTRDLLSKAVCHRMDQLLQACGYDGLSPRC